MLTDKQKRYVELEKKRKEVLEQFQEAVEELHQEIGLGGHFQDSEGTVYQVFEAEGKFVTFNKFEVKRTRRAGERAGALSLTKARDLGYEVE